MLPSQALQKTKSYQFPYAAGITTEKGAYRKKNDTGGKIIAPAKLSCKKTSERNHDYISNSIGSNYPAHFAGRGTQVALHIVERHIHNRSIYDFEQGTHDTGECNDHAT